MLSDILIASAASPANQTGDWKWIVPVLALVLGWGLKWLQDHITEKRREQSQSRLRREQRFDQLRMRRLEAERANLLALQPLSIKFVRNAIGVFRERQSLRSTIPWRDRSVSLEAEEALRESAMDLIPLQNRIHTSEVFTHLNNLINQVTAAFEAESEEAASAMWSQVNPLTSELHRVIGVAIKWLEDENEQLGEPAP